MKNEKLLKIFEELELNKKKCRNRLLRVEISEDELLNLPSREDIEDNVERFIKFKKYTFEFKYDEK